MAYNGLMCFTVQMNYQAYGISPVLKNPFSLEPWILGQDTLTRLGSDLDFAMISYQIVEALKPLIVCVADAELKVKGPENS
ncbi:hypothetical protein PHYBLDRAFT_76478 [Phycomyces blakesleeanus NRRL 1555(-)]|uniref:Uncharacterized protein n=1 Tax=Phycomyces blakesleeanus (strain ATCC 8743b / DSM 1359 / FGSC 10004 / NBRC 33097 / NRRL 1555) TaxID=763407 RepID=A0A167PDN6_PHYB8|nr:hypothetical protein PHYBLDRAFT_76478 [Phycomyces blakesleeanus NRRL 1555(-)]OAD77719.1 hypothetical protein PHYBLDRAFT_76478 [Phycomyces blakesleeanus NRRL 1555(-)]|eukprot:XP_018295759.1 hypothetical protein PHYBLDRAFT_76478 [Phycomyces blakesleeanus NRRL 1555(-)]